MTPPNPSIVIDLGNGEERERRAAALEHLAAENETTVSELVQKIADGELLITDPDQAYFWTPEWQAQEAEADADIAAGRVEKFDTKEDFLDSLRKRRK